MMQKFKRFGILLIGLLLCTTVLAEAQSSKPVCGFSPQNAPAWMRCGSIYIGYTDQELRDAALRSEQTGFKWILQMGHHEDPRIPAEQLLPGMLAKIQRAGLLPHIIAISWGEEWNERCLIGDFLPIGIHPSMCYDVVYTWLGRQNAEVKKAFPAIPTLWVTHLVDPQRRVPQNIDLIALDPYPSDNQTFQMFETLLHVSAYYARKPLVLIPRWFKATGPFQGSEWQQYSRDPSRDIIDGYKRWMQRDDVVGMWGFLWGSRPTAQLVGLDAMPTVRQYVEQQFCEGCD